MFYEPVKCFMNAGVEKSASKKRCSASFHFATSAWIFNTAAWSIKRESSRSKQINQPQSSMKMQARTRGKKASFRCWLALFQQICRRDRAKLVSRECSLEDKNDLYGAIRQLISIFWLHAGSLSRRYLLSWHNNKRNNIKLGCICRLRVMCVSAATAALLFYFYIWCLQGVENFDFMRYATSLFACMWRS